MNSARVESNNVKVETREGEKLSAHISIDGIDNWNLPKGGVIREYIKERQSAKNNPANIKKITFHINGKDYTFTADSEPVDENT